MEVELITDGEALRQWLRLAESVFAQSLCPEDAVWSEEYVKSVLPKAVELRTALHDLIQSAIAGEPAPPASLEIMNAILRANPTYPQIRSDALKFEESIAVRHPDDWWLTAIVRDGADLLCHSDLSLLRQCECATCVRVFYDTTKNHKRKWCVEKCSSQTKAAAYYQRKKARLAKAPA